MAHNNANPVECRESRLSGRVPWLFLALAPALLFTLHLVRNAEFVFFDDATTLAKAQWPLAAFADSTGGGRYLPAFWIYNGLVFRLLPREPWALTAAGGLCLLITCAVWFLLLERMGYRLAGVLTAWLIALNAAAAAVYFHMSTPEILLTAAWSVAFFLLYAAWNASTAEPGESAILKKSLRAAGLLAAGAVTMLAKEPGALLSVCIALWTFDLARRRKFAGHLLDWGVALALLLLAAALVARHLLYGMGPGSYAAKMIYQDAAPQTLLQLLFHETWLIPCTVIAALAGGIWLSLRGPDACRRLALVLTVQLAVLSGFFLSGNRLPTYYWQPALSFAGALLFLTIAVLAERLSRYLATAIGGLIVALHGWQMVLIVSAVGAWNWQCGNLTALVTRERPGRVFFYHLGYWETSMQAGMLWNLRHQLSTPAGQLEWPGESRAHSGPTLSPDQLRPGDWIVTAFQSPANRRFPAMNIAWGNVGDGLNDPPEVLALGVEKIADWRSHFPAFTELPARAPKAHIIWKVYQMKSPEYQPQMNADGRR